MKFYCAEFRRVPLHPAVGPIVTRIHLRAEGPEQARRLAADMFEQTYGAAPAKIGFVLAAVEED